MSGPHVRARRRRTTAVLGLCLSLLVCCGGDEHPGAAEQVRASLVRLSDLPRDRDWKVDDGKGDAGTKGLDKAIDTCERRHDPTVKVAEAEQDADTFTSGDFITVSSSGWVVRDAAKRDEFFDSLDEQFVCVGRALSTYLKSQPMGGVDVEVMRPYSLAVEVDSDRSAERTMELRVKQPGSHGARGRLFFDVVAIEQDELLAGYTFLHTGELSLEQELHVVEKAVARVREQQAE